MPAALRLSNLRNSYVISIALARSSASRLNRLFIVYLLTWKRLSFETYRHGPTEYSLKAAICGVSYLSTNPDRPARWTAGPLLPVAVAKLPSGTRCFGLLKGTSVGLW